MRARRWTGVVLALVACGGAESPEALEATSGQTTAQAARSGPQPDEICDEVVAIQCEAHLRCCRSEAHRYPSEADCVGLLQPLCVQDLSGRAYRDGRISFDPDVYTTALERLRAAMADCEPTAPRLWAGVFSGTVEQGQDCTPAIETPDYSSLLACESELACVVADEDDALRRCGFRATMGDECLDVDCDLGLFCDRSGDTPTCKPLLAIGERCIAHESCATMYCGDDERCAERTARYHFCEDLSYP